MKIHFPNSAFIGNIDPFLKQVDFTDPKSLEITANEKWISVHPIVLSLVAALGLPVKPQRIVCKKFTAKSGHYLERMGLFGFLGIDSGMKIKKHEPAGRFIPLTQIKNQDELTNFVAEMVPLLHLEPTQASSIKYVVSELVRNVLEHAQSDIGAVVCAQYFMKSNKIRIGIVDTGVGIRKTIQRAHAAKSDLDAIHLALIPGITGTTRKEGGTDLNAGAGLFFIKSIAKVNHEYFMIYSGNAMYKLLPKHRGELFADPFRDRHSADEDYPYFRGTAVGVDIALEGNKEFEELLSLIRDIYAKTVKERKRARYQKGPRFI